MNRTETLAPTSLVLRRTYRAPRERLFAAWTTPETIAQFFGPDDVTIGDVTMDPVTGGTYRIEMKMPGGEVWPVSGVYREVIVPERIVCTWKWDEDDAAQEHETLLTLEFHEHGPDTELILTHERFRDAEQRDGHEKGWAAILSQLETCVSPLRITGIDVSGYMVRDGARAIAFYRDVLGLEPARVYPENRGAEYDLPDGTTFGLWGGGGKVMPFQPSNGILFAVPDLDATVADLKQRGIAIIAELETPNCRMAGINDSEGNSIFLHQRKGT